MQKIFIIIIMLLHFSFGFYQLGNAAYVDEPLWLYNRIPKFWENINEQDWNGTRRSDKPGVTIMTVAGIGILNSQYSYECKENCPPAQLKSLFFGFRLPILLLTTLFIPLFYFLLRKLLNKTTAVISVALIFLSPILLGMNRIINPDAFLWLFSTTTILSFLIYLQNKIASQKYIYLAGFLMGLALLTKYVANILFIFILATIFLNYLFSNKKWTFKTTYIYFKKYLLAYLIFIVTAVATFSALYPAVWVKTSRILKATIYSQAFISIWQIFTTLLIFILIDTFIFKNFILHNLLNTIAKYRIVWKKTLTVFFLLIVVAVFWNAFLSSQLFNFEKILASPKSSYGTSNPSSFYLTNFYPLLFGIHPLAIFALFFFSIRLLFKYPIFQSRRSHRSQNIFFFFLFFIFIYYLGGLFSEVAGTVRYQIMLYPLILIMSAISLSHIVVNIKFNAIIHNFTKLIFQREKMDSSRGFTIAILILILTATLFQIKPFYLSYTSYLLPSKYFIDHKDMGTGSYEAAEFLNSLPDAKNLSIWSDKKGVCVFFIGKCYSRFKIEKFDILTFDYYVISSGRKNLTTKKVLFNVNHGHPVFPRIDNLYTINIPPFWQINLANRLTNSIKIFPGSILN